MKTKITLMAAVMAFSYTFAQENPHLKSYSEKIDSIVVSEKSKMNAELDDVDRNFKDKRISTEEKQKQRADIASKYEQIINEKVDAQQSELENATKSMVRSAVLGQKDSLYASKNHLELGIGGVKMKVNGDRTPKDRLRNVDFAVSLIGANLASKDDYFKFYSKDSEMRNTIINSTSLALRYEDQLGGSKSPVFYRLGLGLRTDKLTPKYGQVFTQREGKLMVDEFTRGDMKRTYLRNTYIYIPAELRFVLNPKYTEYNGVKYVDNRKSQLSIITGIYGGVNVGSMNYIKYSDDDSKRIVEKERMMQGVNNFVFGGKLGIGYGGINLFIQKDFTPTFNGDAQLKKKYGLQIGIEIVNLDF